MAGYERLNEAANAVAGEYYRDVVLWDRDPKGQAQNWAELGLRYGEYAEGIEAFSRVASRASRAQESVRGIDSGRVSIMINTAFLLQVGHQPTFRMVTDVLWSRLPATPDGQLITVKSLDELTEVPDLESQVEQISHELGKRPTNPSDVTAAILSGRLKLASPILN